MNSYAEKVKNLFDTNSSEIVANSSPKHVAILYEIMFSHAQEKVNILCKNINPKVFDIPTVIEAVKSFLGKNLHLNIAFQDEKLMDSKFLNMILDEKYDELVKIYKAGQLLVEEKTSANFATMDDHAYRFEPDREYCRAIASANNIEFVAKLNSFFQKVTGNNA